MKYKCINTQTCLMILCCLFCSPISVLYPNGPSAKKYVYTELFTIGVDEPKDKNEKSYQFYQISSIDCDKQGNIYVLDYNAICAKKFNQKGKFIRRFFRKGKGPQEISNAFSIAINRYTDHIFILQDYGFTLKEFDFEGNYVKYHVLPRQFFGKFIFLERDKFISMNSVIREDKFNNFHLVNIVQKKILKEFAPVEMQHELNFKQYFDITGDSVLWTSRGNEMTLQAFDLKTGKKIQEIRIPGKYKENKLLETAGGGDMKLVIPILYNVAQPFVIDDQLFTLAVLQEYREKNRKTDRFPVNWKRIIYQVNGSRFLKLGELEDGEDMYIGTVWKTRLILYSNEPYGRVKVLEFKKH
jgi:hypothetical protein